MIIYTVTRVARSFVKPIEPTPSETLPLSVIDRLPGLRFGEPSLHVFKHGQKPAMVIREAICKALVPYYPLAGRLVDSDQGEVMVECNGEGVWFVEATTNCTLEDVNYLDGAPLMICKDDLLPDPHSEGAELVNTPIRLQVTEFKCGGFVIGCVVSHAIIDGFGAAQFKFAVAEIARGNRGPIVDPIWSRHLFPNPPKLPLGTHQELFPRFKVHCITFHLSIDYITRMKSIYFQNTNNHCSTFDINTATVWQARTRAINSEDPKTPVHLLFFANIRPLLTPRILPPEGGYYGNCIFPLTATALSGDIINAELIDIVRIIRDVKATLPNKLARWIKEELKADPYDTGLTLNYNSLLVTDWTKVGLTEVDYGWGKPVNVIPFQPCDFMAAVKFVKPLVPKKGVQLMTQCVKEEHMSGFREYIDRLA